VCAGIMKGLSTNGMALSLGIAPSSVITFRRNLYRKLGIVSQAELFALGLAASAA
jgi:DNA-binding CsgD family transcriptional regulator